MKAAVSPAETASAPERTKTRVLERLKEAGPQTVQDLAAHLGITKPAARRHLTDLHKQALVQLQVEKPGGRGRPQYVFSLTEHGEEMVFPKTYANLCLEVLEDVQGLYGEEAVERVLLARGERVALRLEPLIPPELPLEEKLERLLGPLREMGFGSRTECRDGQWYLIHHNCPTLQVARCFRTLCQSEVETYSRLLGVPLRREQYILHGQSTCTYCIDPPAAAAD